MPKDEYQIGVGWRTEIAGILLSPRLPGGGGIVPAAGSLFRNRRGMSAGGYGAGVFAESNTDVRDGSCCTESDQGDEP